MPARTTRALTAGESAWLAALPCALALIALLLVAGPPLGDALFKPLPGDTFWFEYLRVRVVRPEPTEQARYLLALLGPLLVSGAALLLAGRRLGTALTAPLVTLAQALLAVFVLACVIAQQRHVYSPTYTSGEAAKTVYFTPTTLVVAGALVLLAVLALQRPGAVARAGAALRETPCRRIAAIAVATLYVLLWLLSAFNTDGSLPFVNEAVAVNIPFWVDEAFSILGGQAPLVDFHAQYGHLWAYIAAGGLTLLGSSFAAYAAIMLAGTAGALAAVYATLRRLASGSSLLTLALFGPFVATSFFMQRGPLENRYGPANLFSVFPIRYAGPFVLLWLVVRRISRPARRPPVALFAFAGLVAINNLEFGIPAFGATIAALLWSERRRSWAGVARLAGAALAGLACAVAAVCLLTLLVAGSLPHFGYLLTFPRIYGKGAFGVLPMPALGLHLVVYLTFAAAIVVATVRAAGRDGSEREEPALTGALAWAGVFGLGAGGYFVGRSHPHVLIDIFSAWALALALLLLVAVPAIVRRPSRRPGIAELLVLLGFALGACSLAQTPAPWSQVQRLRDVPPVEDRYSTAVIDVVDTLTRRGETVALFMKEGHRIADKLGLVDVTPYSNIESMMTRAQWRETIDALRRAHGRKIILVRETLFNEEVELIQRSGFKGRREARDLRLIEFVARPGGAAG